MFRRTRWTSIPLESVRACEGAVARAVVTLNETGAVLLPQAQTRTAVTIA